MKNCRINPLNASINDEAPGNYKYLYNGQEFQEDISENNYAMTFRAYDPAIGRFTGVDLLAELQYEHAPYHFGYGNPNVFADPSGLFPERDGRRVGETHCDDDGEWEWDGTMWVGLNDTPSYLMEVVIAPDDKGAGATGNSVGQPGEWEQLIPVWGPGRAAIDHFQNGNYWEGAGYTILTISDLFLIKSITTAVSRGAWKLGSHTWSATRKWLGKKGYAQSGQHVHHWAVHQKTAKKFGIEAITNQPWNLMPMSNPALHQSIHGVGPNAFGPIGQFWYGTPTWFKAGIVSASGRIIN